MDKQLLDIQEGDELFPIRTVAAVTGVNPITLRAWERRYHLIRPQRTAKGHRLYSQADITLIEQVTGLLKKGISISQVKPLLKQSQTGNLKVADNASQDTWSGYQKAMIEAITSFREVFLNFIRRRLQNYLRFPSDQNYLIPASAH